MGDIFKKNPRTLLRTLSSNVGADRNRFHHRDESGSGLPKYHHPDALKNGIIVPEVRCEVGALPRLLEECEPLTPHAINIDEVDQRSPSLTSSEIKSKPTCVQKAWTYYKLVFVTLSLLIAIFDLLADWYAVKDFHKHEGGGLAIALTVFISISTILFFLECVNGVTSIRVYGFGAGDRNAVEVRREALSYGLLLLEDLPVTIVMFLTFRSAPCQLYNRIFNDSKVARLAMLAAFVSSLWKGLISFKYFIQCLCGEKFINQNNIRRPSGISTQQSLTWDDRLFCWACVRCRPMRMVINIVVSGFAGYVFLQVWTSHPYDIRPECEFPNGEYSAQEALSSLLSTVQTSINLR